MSVVQTLLRRDIDAAELALSQPYPRRETGRPEVNFHRARFPGQRALEETAAETADAAAAGRPEAPWRPPSRSNRSSALEKSGFAVTKVANAKASDTLAAIEAFVKRLAVAENPVVMVYFAGHGVQLAGENYLLPVDAKLGSEEELRSVALSLGDLTSRLDALKSSLQIVVLDSCRNNPFEQTRGLQRGLASSPERLGRIVAYSTSPGNVATDKRRSAGRPALVAQKAVYAFGHEALLPTPDAGL
ncbi:caspase domain-containing protein [Ensifer adhaerens]|uniref:caspase family protein n=1 Tax=Ensifer adhaerens TaxID=106592 RepID=UPI00384AE1FA